MEQALSDESKALAQEIYLKVVQSGNVPYRETRMIRGHFQREFYKEAKARLGGQSPLVGWMY